MEDERWRANLPLTRTGMIAKTKPECVALYLMNHSKLRDRRDLQPGEVRDVMQRERCKAPFRLIEPMLAMHLAHLNSES